MVTKKVSSRIHKPTAIIFLVVVIICVAIILAALYKSADKNDRKFMPTKHHGIKVKKEKN